MQHIIPDFPTKETLSSPCYRTGYPGFIFHVTFTPGSSGVKTLTLTINSDADPPENSLAVTLDGVIRSGGFLSK